MKIVILADPRRKEKDQPLVDEAKDAFDTALYVPITRARFDLSSEITVRYNGLDLKEFDCILPIPTTTHSELFYTAFWMLEDCILPFKADDYLLMMNDEILFTFLKSKGVPVRRSMTVASNAPLKKIKESIKFPVLVRPPNKRVIVTNQQTLKDVLSLSKIGTPVRIEKPIKAERNVWVFVVGDEVVGSYEKAQKASKAVTADDEVKRIAIKVRSLIRCEYCAMRFLMRKENWILDKITLSPNFANFQKVSGRNVARYVISNFADKCKPVKKSWLQKGFEEIFGI